MTVLDDILAGKKVDIDRLKRDVLEKIELGVIPLGSFFKRTGTILSPKNYGDSIRIDTNALLSLGDGSEASMYFDGSDFYGSLVPGKWFWEQEFVIDGLTLTSNREVLNVKCLWNNASVLFDAPISLDVNDTASLAASKLIELRVGGTPKFTVTKEGDVSLGKMNVVNIISGVDSVAVSVADKFYNDVIIGSSSFPHSLDLYGEFDIHSNKIVNLLTPTQPNDAASKSYVDSSKIQSFGGDELQSSLASYQKHLSIVFLGTTKLQNPTKIYVNAFMVGGTSYDIRIQDITNGTTICEVTGLTNATEAIIDMGTLSNLPTGQARWELQLLKTGTGVARSSGGLIEW